MTNQSSSQKKPKALLVGVQLPGTSDAEHIRSMEELHRLADTLGHEVVGQISQKLKSHNASCLVGPGKLQQIAKWSGGPGVVEIETHRRISKAERKREDNDGIDDLLDEEVSQTSDEEDGDEPEESLDGQRIQKVDFVIFDSELTPTQLRNLEQALSAAILDRTGVIVEIFHRHAQSPAAKAQVEIARLTYLTPRLRATGGGERQGGGIGAKGAGETKHELDKRRIRDRIAELKGNLVDIHKEQALRRSRRKGSMKVALVGYTNAGKSSLMRALTGSEVLVADKLFATLDTTVRAIHPDTKPKILVTDTVGFIQKLPHELVASFKSTLDEALDASLLLYVVDASDLAFRQQLATSIEVLTEIEAHELPHVLVLNKIDRLDTLQLNALKAEFPKAQFICTRDAKSVEMLRNFIVEAFEKEMCDYDIHIPYNQGKATADFHQAMRVITETHDENGTSLKVRGFPADFERLSKVYKLRAK